MNETKQQIRAELMALRAEGASNKELIRAACQKLYAAKITPTQTNVLELIRTEGSSPSGQTISNGIKEFMDPIYERYGEPVPIQAEGVPAPIREILGEVAPKIADAAEKLGRSWYQEQVTRLEEATRAAIDAAAGFEQAAKDAHALLDTTNVELAHSRERADDLADEVASRAAEMSRQADMLAQAHEKAHRDSARIETLEADLRASQKEAALMKDARNQTTKELAAARESIAARRAQLDDANAALDAQAKAHASAIDDLKTAHSQEVGRLGYEIAAVKGALEKSESERRVLLVKNGELGGEIRAQAKEIKANGAEADRLKRQLRTAQDELVDERARRASNYADAGRVVEWIRTGATRKSAVSAFTEGPERQIAYAVEDVLAKAAPGAEKR